MLVDEEAAVAVTVEGDAEIGAGLADLGNDEVAIRLQHRVGLVVGKIPVRCPVGLDEVEVEALEQRPDGRAGHPVATVEHDAQTTDRVLIDETQHSLFVLRLGVDLLDAATAGSATQPGLDLAADLLDARVA